MLAFSFCYVAVSIERDLFNFAVEPLTKGTYKKHPYYFIFHSFITSMMTRSHGVPKRAKTEFFFDRRDELGGYALHAWNRMKDDDRYEHRHKLGELAFVSKADPDRGAGVQAADVLAYEIYRVLLDGPDHPRWQARLLLEQCMKTSRFYLGQWTRESIERLHNLSD